MKLFGSTKSKITKNENGKNVPSLGITEVVFVNCNIVNNNYQWNSRVCMQLCLINCLVNYYVFRLKYFYF